MSQRANYGPRNMISITNTPEPVLVHYRNQLNVGAHVDEVEKKQKT